MDITFIVLLRWKWASLYLKMINDQGQYHEQGNDVLLFYSNTSGSRSQMFPLYSNTQFRSLESANWSQEICRENETKLFAIFIIYSRVNINAVQHRCLRERYRNTRPVFSQRQERYTIILDSKIFSRMTGNLFTYYFAVSTADLLAHLLATLSPLLLTRRFRLREDLPSFRTR